MSAKPVTIIHLIEDINAMPKRIDILMESIKSGAFESPMTDDILRLTSLIESLGNYKNTLDTANSTITVEYNGIVLTLSEVRHLRDSMLKKSSVLGMLASSQRERERKNFEIGSDGVQRTVYIKETSQLDFKRLKAVADECAKVARELNELLQQTNWTKKVALIEA